MVTGYVFGLLALWFWVCIFRTGVTLQRTFLFFFDTLKFELPVAGTCAYLAGQRGTLVTRFFMRMTRVMIWFVEVFDPITC